MSLTFPVRSNIGAASAGTLASPGIPNTAGAGSTFTVTGLTSFFDVVTGATPSASSEVVMAIEYGTTNVEKILCTYSSGIFTIITRNYDSTSASVPTHAAGVSVIPVFSATEAAEHNAAAQSLKHVLTNSFGAVTSSAGTVSVGGSGSLGTAPVAAHMDHTHALPTSQLTTWVSNPSTVPGSSLYGAIAPASTIDASQLTAATAGTALPVNVTMGAGQLTGTLTVAQLTNASNTWNVTGTTASSAITGYTNYLILLSAYGHTTATTGSGAYFGASLSATTTTGTVSQTTGIASTINWAGANFVSTSGFQAITASATTASFTLQIVPNSNNASGGSYYAIVIGLA